MLIIGIIFKIKTMHPLIYFVLASLSSLLIVALIEDHLITKLKDTSRFKKWWRSNVIDEDFGSGDK